MVTLEELFRRDKEAKEREKEANRSKREAKKKSETAVSSDDLEAKLELIAEVDPEEVHRDMMDSWKPFAIKDCVVPEFKIPVRKSNNYELAKREQLSRILTFIDFVKRKRSKTGCTIMPIPTTSSQNLLIWEHEKAVSRAVQFMKEIGLITTYDDTYRFGVPFAGGNYGKLYAYYKENEDKVIQYCQDNNIQKHRVTNAETDIPPKMVEKLSIMDQPFDLSRVHFGRDLNLEKPAELSRTEFKKFLTLCLYENYPDFLFHQRKVDEINERYYQDYPELQLRFKPHFTWKGNTVTKIGIRMSNKLCCVKKEDRDEIRARYGLNLEQDVKSSIVRITLSLNTGKWLDESIDVYELINGEFDPGVELTKAEWALRREAIKHYILTAYFEEGSNKMLGKNVTYKLDKSGLVKAEVDDLMGRLRDAIHKVIGDFYGSDIFYIESCIYLMTVYDLLSSGHFVWLLYDGFYASGDIDEETFKEMIQNSVRINFGHYLEFSKFGKELKGSGGIRKEEKKQKTLKVKDIVNRYI